MKIRSFNTDGLEDSPNDESPLHLVYPGSKRQTGLKVPVVTSKGKTIFPCYVYDKDGVLLRIEHRKPSAVPDVGWGGVDKFIVRCIALYIAIGGLFYE